MDSKQENRIVWVLRILVSGLFIMSAFSKLFPTESAIYLFEKQIVDLNITNWCFAPILSRAIIGLELFLGLAILQNNFLKKFIVPVTSLLLIAFCIHLSMVIHKYGNDGNCGCFGQFLPMTPLQAIIKNVITLILLAYIFLKTKITTNDKHRWPILLGMVAYGFVFLLVPPKCACATESNNKIPWESSQEIDTVSTALPTDNSANTTIADTSRTRINTSTTDTTRKKTTAPTQSTPVVQGPPKKNSVFTKYNSFHGKAVDLNEGKKIVAMFALDCEHCMEASKTLNELKKQNPGFPEVYVLAFGEEDQAENFFNEGGGKWPFTILPPQEFFPLLDRANAPPRITVLNNGNIVEDFVNFEHPDKAAILAAAKK
ncbi:MAG: hypothetical protein K1X55_08480 [Chitinophagales bacterium]|nr:hypothetical protein [Chitinophagales bacterium]